MNILYISRYLPYTGGRETFLFNTLQFLSSRSDLKLGLITPDQFIGDNIHFFRYREDSFFLKDIINKFKPDVINCHTHYLINPLANIAKSYKIPFVLTLHGDIFKIGTSESQESLRNNLSSVDHIITVSDQGKQSVLKNTDFKESNISVIYNGIDSKKFTKDLLSNEPAKKILRDIYFIKQNKFVFMTPARMIWYKGLDFLLETLLANKDYFIENNIFFLISTPSTRFNAPELEYMNNFLDKIKENSMENVVKIIFSSYEFMPILYRMIDGFILPSSSEQMPISILEAMASEIPVIVTNVGGVPEIFKDTGYGNLVAYDNKFELFSAIKNTYDASNSKDYKTRLSSIRRYVEDSFSLKIATDNYLSNYNKLIYAKS